jgi:carbohydrate-selective porin OprB
VGTGYGDFGWGVIDLYWKQQFWSDHVVEFRLGRLAPTAYFDATLTSDPYTTFLNFSLNYTPTIAYPADGSLGTTLWVGVTDKLYVLGTILDANSSTTQSGFDTILFYARNYNGRRSFANKGRIWACQTYNHGRI